MRFILVPEVADISEIYQLSQPLRRQLNDESIFLSERLAKLFKADKMNIAAIGNIVSQLHIHNIVRYQTDIAWPAPVWGKFNAVPYEQEQLTQITGRIKCDFEEKLI